MASIYGVELKNIKTWEGVEGYGLQANVYIDKKKVGTVTDDAWGGFYRYDFNAVELDKRADKYRKEIWAKEPENAKYLDLYKSGEDFEDTFIDELYNLCMIEKSWKQAEKRLGFPMIVRYQIGEHGATYEKTLRAMPLTEVLREISIEHNCQESKIIYHAYGKGSFTIK